MYIQDLTKQLIDQVDAVSEKVQAQNEQLADCIEAIKGGL